MQLHVIIINKQPMVCDARLAQIGRGMVVSPA